jgi:hypothetical protein
VLEGMLRMKFMQEVHNVPTSRHFDERTMRVTLSKSSYWLKMKKNVKHYV